MFISGTSTARRSAAPRRGSRGSGLRWRRCAVATLHALLAAHAPRRALDRAVARPPAEHQQLGVAVRVVHLQVAAPRDARDPLGAQPGHVVVVLRLVGDVAGHVLLLQPADPVAQARRAGHRPRAGELVVAQVGHEASPSGWARWRSPGRCRAASRRRAAATARTSWRGRCRRAGSPACGSSTAMRAASIAAWKQSAGVQAATTGSGDSPWRP